MPKAELSPNTKNYSSRARAVCDRIAAGETLEKICDAPGMPQLETLRRWLLDSPDFRRRYHRARRIRAERLVDQVVEIADAGAAAPSEAEARRQRLRIDARKWAVGQFAKSNLDADEAGSDEPAAPRFVD